ncbi:MAG: peptidoglycan-binding domain-containing protein [Bacteroidota bacterium]
MAATLSIGHFDKGANPKNVEEFFAPYHNRGGFLAQVFARNRNKFRDDDRNRWSALKEVRGNNITGEEVKHLQTFLFDAGFMPRSNKDGIFGYVTQAAVRLFQEYIRTIEKIKCKPDGIVGRQTWGHISRWEKEGIKADWGTSEEYDKWMTTLKATKQYYQKNPSPIIDMIDKFPKKSDTRKLDDWEFKEEDIHLVGIRIGEDEKADNRKANDLFFLLIKGMVFKFWGSTDPSAKMAGRAHEAFLVEGQHKYSFAWHSLSNDNKTYRALWPYSKPKGGVLVYRDWNKDNAFDEGDIKLRESIGKTAIDTDLNHTIHIHWSGLGFSNWSAGCQVINGNKYINNKGETIDCTEFAASTYLMRNAKGQIIRGRKGTTKGAYNVLTDLILCYAPMGKDYLLYTMGRDETIKIGGQFGARYLTDALKEMRL